MIDRKTAETARRNALDIEKALSQETESFRVLTLETERRAQVAVWNAFCAEERARLARRDNTLARIRRCRNARLLGRAAGLFLAWGSRHLADVAHTRRGVVLQSRKTWGAVG